jgi:hypothetical protein
MSESLIKLVSPQGGAPEEALPFLLTEMRNEVRAAAKGNRAAERAIGLVIETAIAGAFNLLCEYLLHLSPTNKGYLESALNSHGLALWDPGKNSVLRY